MTNKSKYEYRMYGLTNYQLTGIQKGIQFGHAVVEYTNAFFDTEEYQKWAQKDKTFIVLDGGTTNWNEQKLGTLNSHLLTLNNMGIKHAAFCEPDLGDQLTAVVWLADERVWDTKKYPDFATFVEVFTDTWVEEEARAEWEKTFEAETPEELQKIISLREFSRKFRKA